MVDPNIFSLKSNSWIDSISTLTLINGDKVNSVANFFDNVSQIATLCGAL